MQKVIQDKGNKRVNAIYEGYLPKGTSKPTADTNTKYLHSLASAAASK